MFCRRITPGFSRVRYSSTLIKRSALLDANTLETQIASNYILNKLWTQPHTPVKPEDDELNATSTLPIILRSKDSVFKDVAKAQGDTGFSLKVKQFTTYFKSVIHFYRVGIQNVWRNRKVSNNIKKKYHIETVGKRGEVVQRNVKNGRDLVQVLSSLETLERFEQEALKKIDQTTILSITRREFQTILRTERDFFKIPIFAVILLIFAEMTPVLCMLIPEIAPSTCVFPGLIKKMNKPAMKAQEELNALRLARYSDAYSQGIVLSQSVMKLPSDELALLAKAFNLTSRYIPVGLYPSNVLQSRLLNKFNEIKVDNYFLIHGKQTLWDLNKNELIQCCVQRGLIDFEKDDLSKIGSHVLQTRLFFFLGLMEADKSPANVGNFGLNHLGLEEYVHFQNVDEKTGHDVHSWWVRNHRKDQPQGTL